MILHKRVKAVLLFWLFFYAVTATAQNHFFAITPRLVEAQKQIIELKLNKAEKSINSELVQQPGNIAALYLQNYIDFLTLLMQQDEELLKAAEQNKNFRLEQLEYIPASSPYHLYAKAQFHLQWAIVYAQHEKYLNAALGFKNAYNLLKSNAEKFPDFIPNKKEIGLLKAILGAVPENFKWVLSLTGFKGNITEGMNMVNEVAETEMPKEQLIEQQFARYYLTLLELNYGDKIRAWTMCQAYTQDASTNLISTYVRAYTAQKTGHNDEAVLTLKKRPTSNDYTTAYLFDYELGQALLHKMDDDAPVYLKRFVSFYKGKSLIKEAYKRLSWFYLIKDDKEKYKIYRGLAQKYGASVSNEEKIALKEDLPDYTPHVAILKARLLFDGGYYVKAEEILKYIDQKTLVNQYQRIEYIYRYARVLHEEKKLSQAVDYYLRVIEESGDETYYFAPNSCLLLGGIHEKLGFTKTAEFYYQKALSYKNYEYKMSISQKAKAALAKLEK